MILFDLFELFLTESAVKTPEVKINAVALIEMACMTAVRAS